MKMRYETIVNILREITSFSPLANIDIMRRIEPQVIGLKNAINQNSAFTTTCEWLNIFRTVETFEKCKATPLVATLFEKLRCNIGEQIHCGAWHEITQEQINLFAHTTGDTQWIHLDQSRARKESPFRSTVAHGYLLLGLIPMLRGFEDAELFKNIRFAINCGLDNLRFESPVKPGQNIRATSILKDIQMQKRSIDATEEITVEIENKSQIAFKADVVLRLYP